MKGIPLRYFLFIAVLLASPVFAQADDPIALGIEKRFNSKEVLNLVEPVREQLQQGSAAFFLGHDLVLYGLVVSEDGHIMTKASDLPGDKELFVRIGEDKYASPELVGVDEANDLALVKVKAYGLKVPSTDESVPALGTIVVSNGATTRYARRARLGVISGKDRSIPKVDDDVPYGGMTFAPPCLIGAVDPGSPAEKAGLKQGDTVVALDQTPVTSVQELGPLLYSKKPGDLLTLTIKRGDRELDIMVALASWRETKGEDSLPKSRNDMMSGYVSKRRDGFKHVYEHDSPLPPNFMGGPLLGLNGEVVGLNIARVNRVETYALPIRIVLDSYKALRAEGERKNGHE